MKTDGSHKKIKYKVATFYNFLSILDNDILMLKQQLSEFAKNQEIKGTVLLASEGINGTVCGSESSINQFVETIKQLLIVFKIFIQYCIYFLFFTYLFTTT